MQVSVKNKVMGFRFSLFRLDNLEYFYGFAIACVYLAVLDFIFEKTIVVIVVVIENL